MSESKQMTFNFEPGLSTKFKTVRRYIDEQIGRSRKLKEHIAGEMDMAHSDLTRKLNQNPGDKRTFGTDDLDRYMETQNDYTPILWYIDKYGQHLKSMQDDEIRAKIREYEQLLEANR